MCGITGMIGIPLPSWCSHKPGEEILLVTMKHPDFTMKQVTFGYCSHVHSGCLTQSRHQTQIRTPASLRTGQLSAGSPHTRADGWGKPCLSRQEQEKAYIPKCEDVMWPLLQWIIHIVGWINNPHFELILLSFQKVSISEAGKRWPVPLPPNH